MLELRQLRYFVAVAEELNFSRAAERLHMAQPPVSAAIRKLERDLGAELLLRTTREVSMTPAGREFLAGAYRVLGELERTLRETRRQGVRRRSPSAWHFAAGRGSRPFRPSDGA